MNVITLKEFITVIIKAVKKLLSKKDCSWRERRVRLTVFAALTTIFIISSYMSHEGKSFFGLSMAFVESPGMEPKFGAGSWIVIQKKNILKIKQGDIVAYIPSYDKSGMVVARRVIDIFDDDTLQLVTQGDKAGAPDPKPVEKSELLGKAVMFFDGRGKFFRFLFTSASGFFLIEFILAYAFLLPLLYYGDMLEKHLLELAKINTALFARKAIRIGRAASAYLIEKALDIRRYVKIRLSLPGKIQTGKIQK
ncbi:MAG: signal peptidase I [Oscillospiraceae bacterium]|jgi:signal peptidase I|nr:signal peptidase I [Oscillospiraceae bacterium]